MMTAIQLLAGLALLYYGAEFLVRGGSRIAFALGVTPLTYFANTKSPQGAMKPVRIV